MRKTTKKNLVSTLLAIVLVFSMSQGIFAAASDGMILHYDFADGAKDVSGKNNNGVLAGGATIVDSDKGKAVLFDGEGYIDCSSVSLNELDKFTFALWMKSEELVGLISIMSSNGWTMPGDTHIIFSNGLYYQFSANGMSDMPFTDYEKPTGVWEHVAFTCDVSGGKVYLYINGEVIGEATSDTIPTLYLDGFAIGTWLTNDGTYDRFYKGQMADIRVYNRVLAIDEIKELTVAGSNSGSAEEVSAPEETAVPVEQAVAPTEQAVQPTVPVQAPQTSDTSAMFIALMTAAAVVFMILLITKRNRKRSAI